MDEDLIKEFSTLNQKNNNIDRIRSRLADHAKKCAKVLTKLYTLCKLVQYTDLRSVEEATNILREANQDMISEKKYRIRQT